MSKKNKLVIDVVITSRRHVLFEHASLELTTYYPRFNKRLSCMEHCLLSFDEVHFLLVDGFRDDQDDGVRKDDDGRSNSDRGKRPPSVHLTFATSELSDLFASLCRSPLRSIVCDAYVFLTRHRLWILRHAGAAFGADYIGYRPQREPLNQKVELGADHSREERSLRHGEALFIVGPVPLDEATTAGRVARSVGKRIYSVQRSVVAGPDWRGDADFDLIPVDCE